MSFTPLAISAWSACPRSETNWDWRYREFVTTVLSKALRALHRSRIALDCRNPRGRPAFSSMTGARQRDVTPMALGYSWPDRMQPLTNGIVGR
jgi:hypothetical protein